MTCRIATILLAVAFASPARGQEQDYNEEYLRASKVPPSVVQAAEKEAPGAKFATTYRDNEKGYRLVGKRADGSSISIRVDRDGALSRVRTWVDVAPAKVPKVVMAALNREIARRSGPANPGRLDLDGFTPGRISLVDEFNASKKENASFYEFFGWNGKNLVYHVRIGKGGEIREVKDLLLNPEVYNQRQTFAPGTLSPTIRQEVLRVVPAIRMTGVARVINTKSGMEPHYTIYGRLPSDRAVQVETSASGPIGVLREEIELKDVPKPILDSVREHVDEERELKGFRPVEAWRERWPQLNGRVVYLIYGDDAYGGPVKIEVQPDGRASHSADTRPDYAVGTPITGMAEGIPPGGFAVLAARYGNVGWIDATDLVRAAVPGGVIKVGGGTLPDPSYGQHKALVLFYSVDGKVGMATADDGTDMMLPPKADASKLVEVPARGFAVLAARFGNGDRWTDATEAVRARASAGRLESPVAEIPLPDPAVGQSKVLAVAYAEDGRVGLIVTHQSHKVTLPLAGPPVNSSALEFRKIEFPQKVIEAAYSPDGRQVVVGVEDGSVRVLDPSTGRETHRFDGHGPGRVAVTFSANGNLVLSGGADKTLRLWDLKTDKGKALFRGHTEGIHRVALSPNGRQAASVSSWEKAVRLWDVATAKEVREFEGHTEHIDGLAFTPDGKLLITSSWDHSMRSWDVATGKQLRRYEGDAAGALGALALARDGRSAFVGTDDRTVRRVDVATAAELARYSTNAEAGYAVAAMPDARRFLAGDGTSVLLWDVASDRMALRLDRHTARVRCIAVSPDGKRAVTGGEDRFLRFWNIPEAVR